MTGVVLLVAFSIASTPQAGVVQPAPQPGNEVIAAIRVHGNHTTPDEDVAGLAGIAVGQAVTATTVDTVAAALRKSGRFRSVEVRKRYVSFDDPTAVILVIIIEERIGISVGDPTPGPMRRFKAGTMWLPVLNYEDGYGWTYGARFAFPDFFGRHTRIAVPLTWGGEREASVSVEQAFDRGPVTRIIGTGGVWHREVPAFDTPALRSGGTIRIERAFVPSLRAGFEGGAERVSYDTVNRAQRHVGADLLLDTRREPTFPRHAVFAKVGVDWLWSGGAAIARPSADVRGYLGLPARFVVVVRGLYEGASDPLPPWEQAMLGGTASLRGFRVGYRYGDQLASVSAEVRHPLSSPLSLVKMGWAVFMDVGTTYGARTSMADARFDRGVGGGVFLAAPVLSIRVDVAHGLSAGTRGHVSVGVRF
jgi:outer membrane protein assembly factor BamA